MRTSLARCSSRLATLFRFGRGRASGRVSPPPSPRIDLYDFEGCPFCRIVREAITELDLDVTVYPCPKGGRRFRNEVVEAGGKAQFPYLVDRGRDVALYESDEIVAYLYRHYGDGEPPRWFRRSWLRALLSSAASLVRGAAGTFRRGTVDLFAHPVLYSAEGSPEARLVREELCVLEIAYELISVGRGSAKLDELAERSSGRGIPLFCDTSSGRSFHGVAEILDHLRSQAL